MRILLSGLLAACLAALSSDAQALERGSAAASRQSQTSALEDASLKPVMLFSMRGRHDPFMAYSLLTTTALTDQLSISDLTYSGLLEVEGSAAALFRDTSQRSYSLRGSSLIGPDNSAVAGIRGRISEGKDRVVTLEQGERRIVFSAKSTSKRFGNERNR